MSSQLRLLEVRRDPHAIERDDRHQRLARLNHPPGLDRLLADDAGRPARCRVERCRLSSACLHLRLGQRDARGRRAGLRLARGDLLRLRLRGAEARRRLDRDQHATDSAGLSRLDGGFRLDDLRLCSFNRRPSRRPRRPRSHRIAVAQISSFASRPFEPLDIARVALVAFASCSRCRACAALSLARARPQCRAFRFGNRRLCLRHAALQLLTRCWTPSLP